MPTKENPFFVQSCRINLNRNASANLTLNLNNPQLTTNYYNMADLNRIQLIGRLTRDPETKALQNDKHVSKISLAINRTYNQGDDRKEEVTFIDVVYWNKLAQIVDNHLKKGS